MDSITAREAKQLAENYDTIDIEKILKGIKDAAISGQYKFHYYDCIGEKTKQILEDRGFKVFHHGIVAIQRDGLYYTISW